MGEQKDLDFCFRADKIFMNITMILMFTYNLFLRKRNGITKEEQLKYTRRQNKC